MNFNFKNSVVCFLFLCSLFFKAQEDGGFKLHINRQNPTFKTRLGISPVLGLYSIRNTHHATKPKPKMAFCVSVKKEIRLDKKNKSFLMLGAEYMMHGVNFNSFYFYPDSIKLYTGNMNAKYSLVMHELIFPIQLKYSFQKENNSIFSNYIFAGYCYRWLFESNLTVTNYGEQTIKQQEVVKFKSPAFNPNSSSFYTIGMGIQKNTQLKHNAVFAEVQLRFAPSPLYFNESFSPSNLYINSQFIYMTVGFKF